MSFRIESKKSNKLFGMELQKGKIINNKKKNIII